MEHIYKYFRHKYTHLTLFLIISIIIFLKNTPAILTALLSFTVEKYLHFLAFIFLSSFLTITIKQKIKNKYPETEKGINLIAWIFFTTLIVIYVLYYNFSKDYQPTIALLVSSVLLGSGWWVQATVSKVAARKSHTINTLMTQRNSDLFNRKSSNVANVFGHDHTVNEIIAKQRLTPTDKELTGKEIKQEYSDAALDLIYTLNYYEFICSGIRNSDFDEHLMKDCLSGLIVTLEIRAFHILKIAREKYGKASFENLIFIVNKWSDNGGSLILKIENGEQIGTLTHTFRDEDCYTLKAGENTEGNNSQPSL